MIKYDCSNIHSKIIGEEHGLNLEEKFDEYSLTIKEIINDIKIEKDFPNSNLNWINFYKEKENLNDIKEYAKRVEGKFENIFIIGLSAPLYGAKAIFSAITGPYWNHFSREKRGNTPQIYFLNNIDPDNVNALFQTTDLRRTLVVVVSKYGQTPETTALFMYAKKMLENEIGENYPLHIVTCCHHDSILAQISKEEGYYTFDYPENIDGRLGTFSHCGLLPLILAGINIDELLEGVEEATENLLNPDIHENIAAQDAIIHYLAYTEKQKTISVLLPYADRLKWIPDLYIQLNAECLNRRCDINGKAVQTGQMSVYTNEIVDQPTLMQSFIEGPNDKIIDILQVEKPSNDCIIPKLFNYTGIGYLGGKSFTQLINADIIALTSVLSDNNRPCTIISLPEISPFYMGNLLTFLFIKTIISAKLYNTVPLGEISSENTSDYFFALMGQNGYEETARELREKLAQRNAAIL